MKISIKLKLILILSFSAFACGTFVQSEDLAANRKTADQNFQSATANLPKPENSVVSTNENRQLTKSDFQSVDFYNFTFPIATNKEIKIKKGRFEFEDKHCLNSYKVESIDYADLTNDGAADALINLSKITACGSSARTDYFYVYSEDKKQTRLEWQFVTGTQANGGLKEFHIDGSDLIIELYGKVSLNGTKIKVDDSEFVPECCPRDFTRLRFAWSENNLDLQATETFPYSEKSIR